MIVELPLRVSQLMPQNADNLWHADMYPISAKQRPHRLRAGFD